MICTCLAKTAETKIPNVKTQWEAFQTMGRDIPASLWTLDGKPRASSARRAASLWWLDRALNIFLIPRSKLPQLINRQNHCISFKIAGFTAEQNVSADSGTAGSVAPSRHTFGPLRSTSLGCRYPALACTESRCAAVDSLTPGRRERWSQRCKRT